MRLKRGTLLAFVLSAGALSAQESTLPTITVTAPGLTPKLIGKAFDRVFATQKFKASASSRRIVLTQRRGNLPQTNGEIVTVQLEVGIRLDPLPSGYTLTVTDETLVADRGGFEQRRPQELSHNASAYQTALARVKADLEGGATPPPGDSTMVRDSIHRQ